MRNMSGHVRISLAAILWAGVPLLAQTPASTDARAELSKVQDIEYQVSEAFVNGVRTAFAGQPSPTISFHSGGVISGHAGIARYYATIQVAPDGSFSFEPPGLAITTLRVGRIQTEAAFLNALQATRFIRIESDGIAFETSNRATRLKFTPIPATQGISELLNVELVLVRLISNGKEIAIPSTVRITLTFQDQGRFSGRSAVNSYAGIYSAQPDGKIAVQNTMSTLMAGPPELMALESAYFEALRLAAQVRVKTDRVVLEGGTASMEFAIGSPK